MQLSKSALKEELVKLLADELATLERLRFLFDAPGMVLRLHL